MWPEMRFELIWKGEGGGGANITWTCANDMDLADVIPTIERIRAQRQRESDAVKALSRKR